MAWKHTPLTLLKPLQRVVDDPFLSERQNLFVEPPLESLKAGRLINQTADLLHIQPWSDSLQRRVAALVFQRGQKIKIPDFFVLLLDYRQADLIYPEVHLPWITE